MNPSDASKPVGRSGSSAQEQAGLDDSNELLIRVPIRDPDAGEEPPPPAAAGPKVPPTAARGTAGSAGRKRAASADQARPLFTMMAGAGSREAGHEGVDRVRSGPPPEPDAASRIRFARLHLRTGSLMTARVQYEALAATGDLDVPGLLDLAEVRWRTADLSGAGAAAAEYLSRDGDHALGFLIAAEAAARGGRQVEARRSAEIAAERLGKDLDAVFSGLPRRLNWAGVSPGPASAPPVAIKIETPSRPERKAPDQESAMVSSEALWAQIVEVAQAADQAGQIADEKTARPEPKPGAKPAAKGTPEATTAPEPAAAPEPEVTPPVEAKAEAAPEPAAAPEPEVTPPVEAKAEAAPEPAAAPEPEVTPPVEAAPEPAAAPEAPEPAAAPGPAAAPEAALGPALVAPGAGAAAQPWDESVAAGSAALEAADPLLAALHFAMALRMSPQAAPAVLAGIGDRRDLALELVRVDAIRVDASRVDASRVDASRVAAEASAAEGAVAPAPAQPVVEPPRPDEPVRRAAPEPPPIRWE